MSRRKRSFRPGLWLLLAGLIALLVFANRPSQPLQVRRLPDGSTLSLEAITYGPQHRFVPGGRLAGLFASLLPRQLGYWTGLGAFEREVRPDPSVPVVWTVRRGATPGTSPLQYGLGDMADWTVFDEHGCERPAAELATYHTGGRTQVVSFALRTFPRRGTWVGLRMYGPNRGANRKPVAEFRLPNPDPGPHPRWEAQPLPQSVREPDLVCTLKQFTTGCGWDQGTQPTREGRVFGSWTYVEIETQHPDGTPARWLPVEVTLIGATGNQYESMGRNVDRKGATSRISMHGMLPYCERVWKVRVHLAPTAEAPYRAEETWTVPNIPVPDWGESTTVAHERTVHGVKIGDLGLVRATPSILAATLWTDSTERYLTLVRLIDDRGRPVIRHPVGEFTRRTNLGWSRYEIGFTIRGGAKTLTATFAYPTSRIVEFEASPKYLIPPPVR